jgi:hypothetical protein
LYLSHDFRVLNDWDRYVLVNTEAIAVDQDPAGTPGRRLRGDADTRVWVRTLADGARAVVLLNAGGRPRTVAVRWSELGLPAGPIQVRDLWAHRNLGAFKEGYEAKALPPRGCAFLKVVPGDRPPSEPRHTWAAHPGRKPAFTPLPSRGWTAQTSMARKDDPLGNLFDGNPATGWWSYAQAGDTLTVDFGKPLRFDRVVIDHRDVGPNPWPYTVYAPRSTFALEVSANGKTFTRVTADSFGPAYTVAAFRPVTARYLRIVLRDVERTSAYEDAVWGAKDVYVFDTGAARR